MGERRRPGGSFLLNQLPRRLQCHFRSRCLNPIAGDPAPNFRRSYEDEHQYKQQCHQHPHRENVTAVEILPFEIFLPERGLRQTRAKGRSRYRGHNERRREEAFLWVNRKRVFFLIISVSSFKLL